MSTVCCPHPSPLSKERDWYSQETSPAEMRTDYALIANKKIIRYQRIKRSYAEHSAITRRRRIYEASLAALAAHKGFAALGSAVISHEHKKDFASRLRAQADKWQTETSHLSSPLQRMMHPSYQAILGMSAESADRKNATIRFMLEDLRKTKRNWLLALSYLTQQNPIEEKDYGKTDRMIASWIKWGEEQGLIENDRLSKRV